MLPPVDNPNSDAGERLAAHLADVSKAWTVTTPEERNGIARALFASVIVDNKQAVACVPRPELKPFFRSIADNQTPDSCYSGSDGNPSREIDVVSPPLIPVLHSTSALGSLQRSESSRYSGGTRPTKIPEHLWPSVVERSKSQSLRSLARDFGVSHETVRAVLREQIAKTGARELGKKLSEEPFARFRATRVVPP